MPMPFRGLICAILVLPLETGMLDTESEKFNQSTAATLLRDYCQKPARALNLQVQTSWRGKNWRLRKFPT